MEIPIKTEKIKINKAKLKCLILVLSILTTVGIGTVLGNKVFAAEVYPTNQVQQITSKVNNIDTSSIWDMFSQFIAFVKENIAKNNSDNKYSFNLEKDTNQLLNNNILTNSNKFIDIKDHPNREYINFLAEHNIISNHSEKFNPQNFVRLHECSKLIINSHRFKLWYDLNTNIWLTNNNYFNTTLPKYYNTAYEMWILNWVLDINNFERVILYDDLYVILKNFENQYPDIINIDNISKNDFHDPDNHIERWELTKSIVDTFELNWNLESELNLNDETKDNKDLDLINIINNKYTFTDIENYKYKNEIEELINLWIIENSITEQFYPDQSISRSEFISMITKSYLSTNNLELSINNLSFDITDLDYNSNYASYIIYAKEKGILDYLIEVKQEKTYIKPNDMVSRHEVYHVITDMLWIEINQDTLPVEIDDYISRWEIVKILSDTLGFQNNTNSEASPANSKLEQLFNKIETFTEYKQLASLIL